MDFILSDVFRYRAIFCDKKVPDLVLLSQPIQFPAVCLPEREFFSSSSEYSMRNSTKQKRTKVQQQNICFHVTS